MSITPFMSQDEIESTRRKAMTLLTGSLAPLSDIPPDRGRLALETLTALESIHTRGQMSVAADEVTELAKRLGQRAIDEEGTPQ